MTQVGVTFEGCLSGDGAGVVLRDVTCGHIEDGLFLFVCFLQCFLFQFTFVNCL